MKEKKFNKYIEWFLLYLISIILIVVGITLFICMILILGWQKYLGIGLLLIAIGLMGLALAVNKGNDITIDYKNKEIMFNIKFNGKPNICVPFDAVVDVYLYNSNQLKEEVKLKKYPKLTLVIERKYHKEFIPLTGFREKEINILVKEIEIVRDSYEEII